MDEVEAIGTSASTRTSITATATVDAVSAINTLVRHSWNFCVGIHIGLSGTPYNFQLAFSSPMNTAVKLACLGNTFRLDLGFRIPVRLGTTDASLAITNTLVRQSFAGHETYNIAGWR